jgi:hypothetical protein
VMAGRSWPTNGAGPLGAHLEAIRGVGWHGDDSGEGARRWRPWRAVIPVTEVQRWATGDGTSYHGS